MHSCQLIEKVKKAFTSALLESALRGSGTMDLSIDTADVLHCFMCCTPAFLRDHDDAVVCVWICVV